MISQYPYYEFEPGIFEIDEFDCASIFLIVGSKRAFLLDTGIGIGDLKTCVERLTDKQYDIVMSHGHGDHTGGTWAFDSIYMNSRDIGVYAMPPEMEKYQWTGFSEGAPTGRSVSGSMDCWNSVKLLVTR